MVHVPETGKFDKTDQIVQHIETYREEFSRGYCVGMSLGTSLRRTCGTAEKSGHLAIYTAAADEKVVSAAKYRTWPCRKIGALATRCCFGGIDASTKSWDGPRGTDDAR